MKRRDDWTKILGWPGYQVYQHELDEKQKTLKLWVRRKRNTDKRICSGCGQHCGEIHDITEREVRDLPWSEYRATVVVELYRVRCPRCAPKIQKVAQLPSKAPFSKRFEEAVGQACESASARQVAHRFVLAESTVRAIDLRYLERWSAGRRKPALPLIYLLQRANSLAFRGRDLSITIGTYCPSPWLEGEHYEWNAETNEVFLSNNWKEMLGFEEHQLPDS